MVGFHVVQTLLKVLASGERVVITFHSTIYREHSSVSSKKKAYINVDCNTMGVTDGWS